MIEQLCAAYIVANRLQRNGSLHEVTLTRKWVTKLYAAETLKNEDCNLLYLFVELIPSLLWEMYTGSSGNASLCISIVAYSMSNQGFLVYDGNYRIDYQVRHIFVSRV